MKKQLILLVAILFLSSCGTMSPEEPVIPPPEEKSLYQYGVELIATMDELVGDEDYLRLYFRDEAILDVARSVAEQPHTDAETVYRITLPEEALLTLMQTDTMPDFSEEVRARVEYQFHQRLLTATYNGLDSAKSAVGNACTVNSAFVSDTLDGTTIYLYVYEDAVPVGIIFQPGADDTVCANGVFIMNDNITEYLGSPQSVREYFVGQYPLDVSTVSVE